MTDQALYELAKRGENKAYCEIIKKYRGSLSYMIFQMTQNKTDTEDLFMEVVEKIYENINNFTPVKAKFSTWIYAVAKNHTLDFLRNKIRQPNCTEDIKNYHKAEKNTPEKQLIIKQEYEILKQCIKKLKSTHHREVMELYTDGLKMKEISEQLNLPIGTTVGYINRAKKKLNEKSIISFTDYS